MLLLISSKGEPDPIITHSRLTSGYESFRRRSNSMDSFFRCPSIFEHTIFCHTCALDSLDQTSLFYIQVAETVKDEEMLKRELAAFKNIPNSYPRILITMDRNLNSDFNGIRNINALDFLTGKEKLVF